MKHPTAIAHKGPQQGLSPVQWLLTGIALMFVALFLVLPILAVLAQAFQKGLQGFLNGVSGADTLSAIKLTLLTACIAVPLNLVFGIAAAWSIAKFDFPGKSILITLIDLPFAVSPVISGLIFVLLYGSYGLLGSWLARNGIKIIFATPGIIMATVFATFPFVARELIPLMQAQGTEEEEAAVMLGAGGWQTFWRITQPNIRWGLVYGIILCTARAMGEFGAVSVVSGHIRGFTNTVPLHIEILYNEYNFVAAFSVASLLVMISLATILVKGVVERKTPMVRRPDTNEEGERI